MTKDDRSGEENGKAATGTGVRHGSDRKKETKRGSRGLRKFPATTLEQALTVAQMIRKFNGGNSWPPAEVAKSLEIAPKTAKFWYLTSAARDYKITTGTRDTPQIELTALGRSIVYADDPVQEAKAIREA